MRRVGGEAGLDDLGVRETALEQLAVLLDNFDLFLVRNLRQLAAQKIVRRKKPVDKKKSKNSADCG